MGRTNACCVVSLVLSLLATAYSQNGRRPNAPPPNIGRNRNENITDLTIDQIITGTLGGVDVASNMILADDGKILAELDMYLTKDQFLSMYEPPKPEQMVEMGMMPAPLGTDDKYFYDIPAQEYNNKGSRSKRKAARSPDLRWTNAEVPYLFASGHFDDKEEYMMRRSMTEWERYTCMNFRPATSDDRNSLRFQNGVGCNSQLGMVGGIQVLNLQAPGCRFKGLYLHEIGHALGLVHEHQLPDRDYYIEIVYRNVSPHMRIWFNKYTSDEVNQMTVPYEYSSVMHYGITAFSYDGKAQTIRAHDVSKEDSIGKVYLKELSYTDVHIVNKMYNCSGHCSNQNKCGADGHLDQNCNCICRDGSQDCDITKQRTDATCVNVYHDWACYIWANQGECERNPFYMNNQCAKACGACGSSNQNAGECKDVYDQDKCIVWKKRGDCVTNSRWMKEYCGATCSLCGNSDTRPEVMCSNSYDDNDKCAQWAMDGECEINPVWMFKNCKKACAKCLEKDVDNTDGGEVDEENMECVDTNDNCAYWASTNQCEENPSWMINNCRMSCNKCDDGTCKNFYDDTQCEIWAQKLECVTNIKWMRQNCAKACRHGPCSDGDGGEDKGSTTTRVKTITTESPTTSGSCRNKHSSDTECSIWANNDHCNINPTWMGSNCAKACNKCGGGGGGGGTGDKTTTTKETGTTDEDKEDECEDREVSCASWAKHGYCDTNPRYNLIFCKKSCNNCNGCRDAEFLCSVWAKDGHCQRNARYMLRHCQKSCKACSMSQSLEELRPGGGGEGGEGEGGEGGEGDGRNSGDVPLLTTILLHVVVMFNTLVVCQKFNFL